MYILYIIHKDATRYKKETQTVGLVLHKDFVELAVKEFLIEFLKIILKGTLHFSGCCLFLKK